MYFGFVYFIMFLNMSQPQLFVCLFVYFYCNSLSCCLELGLSNTWRFFVHMSVVSVVNEVQEAS